MGNAAIKIRLEGRHICWNKARITRYTTAFLAFITAALLLLPGSTNAGIVKHKQETGHNPAAAEGVIDLRGWNFKKQGKVNLNGEWLFYGHELLTPQQLSGIGPALYAEVPRSWNSYPAYYGLKNGQGYATYKLTILLTPEERRLVMRVPNIFSSYKLWVNNKVLAEAGAVGTDRSTATAEQYPRLVVIDGNADKLELVVQVSNFHHRKGGIWKSFTLGENKELVKAQTQSTITEMVIFGSLFIVGLYHIGLFAFRRQERFTLYFGLLCLFVAARTIVTGDAYLMQMFPGISWEFGLKVEYISFSLSAVTGFLYICCLFPQDISMKVKRSAVWIGTLSTLPVVFMPALYYSQLLPGYQIFVLGVCVYTLYVLVLAIKRRREGACFVLAGVLVFVLTIMNDMLFYNEWYANTQLVPLGLFFFILMQAFIISSRFSHALQRVEQVSKELRELNAHLEERIAERTEALQTANESLERTNHELAKVEKSRRHLMTNISHDLRTPITLLQGYLEAMQDGVVQTEDQQKKYIRMMLGKVAGLNRLIRDLFELSKLEAGQHHFVYTEILLSEWMERIRDLFELDIRSHGLDFEVLFFVDDVLQHGDKAAEQVILQLDQARMERVMANLIYNAIKYTDEGGKILIFYHVMSAGKQLEVKVADTGHGIAEEHLPFIFDRFYKKEQARSSSEGGSGLGLAIVKEIIENHQGRIAAESTLGKGTVIKFIIPYHI